MPDPTLGVPNANYNVQPGWTGVAHIDRTSDPLAYAIGTLTVDVRSPDGKSSIQVLAVPFHTFNVSPGVAAGMPGDPAHQRNAAITRFTSTADLLKRYILPLLQIQGQVVETESIPAEMAARIRAQQQGVPNPIFDMATVLYRKDGRDVLVRGATIGGDAGSNRENTTTSLVVVTAPEGKAHAVLNAQDALPGSGVASAAWQQANTQYLADWRHELERQTAASTAQFQRDNKAIIAMGHSNIALMQQRGAARDRAFAEHEQQVSDSGANFRGYLSGSNVNFKWCSANDVTYTTNDTRSPGAGYQRCN